MGWKPSAVPQALEAQVRRGSEAAGFIDELLSLPAN